MDPRMEKTREAVGAASLRLLEEEGWQALSVNRLCREARVGRSTFYVHYRGLHEPIAEGLLLRFAQELPEHLVEMDAQLDPDTLLRNGRPLSYPVYAHVWHNRTIYERLFAHPTGAAALASLRREVATASHALHAPLREAATRDVAAGYLAHLLAGALFGTLEWWLLEAEQPLTPVQMSYEFSFVVAPGVLARLGLSNEP